MMQRDWRIAALVLAVLSGPAFAQSSSSGSSSGISDVSPPGPLADLSAGPFQPDGYGNLETYLYWTEAYDDTSNTSGTGVGAGGKVTSRQVFYRTDHALVTASDYSSATMVLNLPAILNGGVGNTVKFNPPAEGVTYWFGIKAMDDAGLITYGNCVSQAVSANATAASNGGNSPGNGCAASPARSRVQEFVEAAGGKVMNGMPVLLLAACLTGIGYALRRP